MSSFNEVSTVVQNIYFWIVTMGVGVIVLATHLRNRSRAPGTAVEWVSTIESDHIKAARKIISSMTCCVVDDKPDDFPVEFMKGFFRSVSIETRVSLNDAARISGHDVIFLDVADVVVEDMRRGGAILIKRLRELRKDIVIISVSSKKYDVEVTDYFADADLKMRKPIKATTIEEQLVAHFDRKVGPYALAAEIDQRVDRMAGERKLKSLISALQCSVEGNTNKIPILVRRAGVESQCARLISQIKTLRT